MSRGLLEAIGGAMAGAGKGYAEGWADKMKSEAQALRDENMARLEDTRQKAGFANAKELQDASIKSTQEIHEKSLEANRVEGILNRGAQESNIYTQGLVNENAAANKAARDEESKKSQFGRDKEIVKYTDELARKRDEEQNTDKRKVLDIQLKNAREVQKLQNEAPGPTGKLFDDLKRMGYPADKAMDLVGEGLSGAKQDRKDYITLVTAQLETLNNNAKLNMVEVTPEQVQEVFNRVTKQTGITLNKGGAPATGKDGQPTLIELLEAVKGMGAAKPGTASASKPVMQPEPEKPPQVWGPSAMGKSISNVFGPGPRKRKEMLQNDLKSGTISKPAYDKAIREADAQISAGVEG